MRGDARAYGFSVRPVRVFTAVPRDSGGTIFFPADGYRVYGGGVLGNVRVAGVVWEAVPLSADSGRTLHFASSVVEPLRSGFYRSYGVAVRPVRVFTTVRQHDRSGRGTSAICVGYVCDELV